jgi:bacterioferritin-associated ferredoxin
MWMPRVYICLCNALTDKRLKQAVAETDGKRPGDVYAACGCRVQCGRCVKVVLQMLRDHCYDAALQEKQLAGAD